MGGLSVIPSIAKVGVMAAEGQVDLWVLLADEDDAAEAEVSRLEREYRVAVGPSPFELHVVTPTAIHAASLPPFETIFARYAASRVAHPDRHFDQAHQNRALAEQLSARYATDPNALQWAVTMALYAALHCLTGYLVQRGVQVYNHQARDAAIAHPRNGVPQDVYDAYVRLKGRSTGAHYLLQTFSAA